jgi:membrane protease YdiL (CAAX protease family)
LNETARPGSPRWQTGSRGQLLHALLLVLLLMSVFGVMQLWAARGQEAGFDPDEPSVRLFALLGVAVLLQAGGVVGLGLLYWGRMSLPALGWRSRNFVGDVGFGLLGFGLLVAVVLALSAALGSPVRETLDSWLHQPPRVRLLSLCIGLLAAFNEESLFRGYLQPGLVARVGAAPGVLVAALVFALYHGNFAPLALLGKLLFGVVFGVLAYRRKSLVPSGLAHLLTWGVMGFS